IPAEQQRSSAPIRSSEQPEQPSEQQIRISICQSEEERKPAPFFRFNPLKLFLNPVNRSSLFTAV
ncbi:hypothetical protein, partial [Holdemania filiformis]|uniref:hypothetical protein n=1 Tax=Holdemania filiformis TaxID=61171 RepID=UPI001AD7F50D